MSALHVDIYIYIHTRTSFKFQSTMSPLMNLKKLNHPSVFKAYLNSTFRHISFPFVSGSCTTYITYILPILHEDAINLSRWEWRATRVENIYGPKLRYFLSFKSIEIYIINIYRYKVFPVTRRTIFLLLAAIWRKKSFEQKLNGTRCTAGIDKKNFENCLFS